MQAPAPNIIADLYEAVFDPNGLGQIPNVVRSAMGVDSAGLWLMEDGRIGDMALTADLHEAQKPYVAHFHKLDPWQFGGRPHSGLVLGCESLAERDLVRTEFYNDFARSFGLFRPLGALFRLNSRTSVYFALHRPATKQLLEESDKRAMQAMVPHLRRALQLWLKHRGKASASDARTSALDAFSFGVVVCDGGGRLIEANAAAEALARSGAGIVLGNGGVRAQVVHEAHRLAALIRSAACGGGGGAIRLTGSAGTASLLVLVTPLAAKLDRNGEPGHVLIAMRLEDEGLVHGADRLAALFGLSPNQAALAVALYEGKTFEEIAQERGVKVTTLRSHFAQVLSRTGARSQRDLMRLVGNLPPVRRDQ